MCERSTGRDTFILCALHMVGLALHWGSRELVVCPICALCTVFLLGYCGKKHREVFFF